MENFKYLLLDYVTEFVLRITLNRPEVMNAINFELMQELYHLWESINQMNFPIRCLILTGNGKAFCSGADLKERNNLDLGTWRRQHIFLEKAMSAMIDCPYPIIAAVNGAAFGGGLELTLAADFAYAARTALFAQAETKWGLMPAALGTQNLPQACGLRRAKELGFTAKTFTAQEAYQWGIVNKVCEPDDLMDEVVNTAIKISTNAPLAVSQLKKAMQFSDQNLKAGFLYEIEGYNRLLDTKDRQEGIHAFNEKRQPVFTGE